MLIGKMTNTKLRKEAEGEETSQIQKRVKMTKWEGRNQINPHKGHSVKPCGQLPTLRVIPLLCLWSTLSLCYIKNPCNFNSLLGLLTELFPPRRQEPRSSTAHCPVTALAIVTFVSDVTSLLEQINIIPDSWPKVFDLLFSFLSQIVRSKTICIFMTGPRLYF